MAPSDQTILISGGSGFLGNHIVHRFLSAGYKVRTTVRSESTKEKVIKVQKNHPNLSFSMVPDGQADGAYDEAVKGVDGVIHTASPFVLKVENNEKDLLKPAIQGTKGMLESIKKYAPQVKRVVVTSSFASIIDLSKGPRVGHVYTEADWNPVTYEEAAKSDNGSIGYCASKALAEKAAWDFVKDEKPNFQVATICPPMVYGPSMPESIADLKNMNTSTADIYRLMNGTLSEVPPTAFFGWVDSRDVAEAHLKAYEVPEAAGQRYFTTGGRFTYQMIVDVIRKNFPELKKRSPEGKPGDYGPETYDVSNAKATKELGIQFRDLETSIKDMVEDFLATEKRLGVTY